MKSKAELIYFDPYDAREWMRQIVHSPSFWLPSVPLVDRLVTWWCEEHEALDAWRGIEKTKRIGYGFEKLVIRFVELSPYLSLFKANWVLYENKISIGELDLIVETPEGVEHWELGLKFYLYDGVSDCFIGSNGRDQLHLKLEKIRDRQMPLIEHEQVRTWQRDSNIQSIKSSPLVVGRLFYPWSATVGSSFLDAELDLDRMLRGVWLRVSQWNDYAAHHRGKGRQLFRLERYHWMLTNVSPWLREEESGGPSQSIFQGVVLGESEVGRSAKGRHAHGQLDMGGHLDEIERFYVVRDDWPAVVKWNGC
jgi:hypothetical protein